jgi:DNA modification methylase
VKRKNIPVDAVNVPADRIRELDQERAAALAIRIARYGLLHPITVIEDGEGKFILIAGRHRLEAFVINQQKNIPASILDLSDPTDRLIVEYEENVRRKDLSWQDNCLYVLSIHEARCNLDEEWNSEKTAEDLAISDSAISRYLNVGRAIRENDVEICEAQNLSAANAILERRYRRSVDREISDFVEAGGTLDVLEEMLAGVPSITSPSRGVPKLPSAEKAIRPAKMDIHVGDFFTWAPEYSGPKSDFIHLDPPYGISHDESDQGGARHWNAYEDTPEIFWKFLNTLVDNQDNLMQPKCHIMLWFTMNFYRDILAFFEKQKGFKVLPHPLIWYKSDNTGIVPDPLREGRRVYETALVISRGDRLIRKSASNLAAFPANKHATDHISEKPRGMLSQFFRMFVEPGDTTFLDVCCGSGSSVVAAAFHRAKHLYALDLDDRNVETARGRLDSFRLQASLGQIDYSTTPPE